VRDEEREEIRSTRLERCARYNRLRHVRMHVPQARNHVFATRIDHARAARHHNGRLRTCCDNAVAPYDDCGVTLWNIARWIHKRDVPERDDRRGPRRLRAHNACTRTQSAEEATEQL
jgi:hypothetical protein